VGNAYANFVSTFSASVFEKLASLVDGDVKKGVAAM
jgi:hypothetical protein